MDSEQAAGALGRTLADMAACSPGRKAESEEPVDAWLLGSYSDSEDSVANVSGSLAALHAAPGFSVALRGVCVLAAATRAAAPTEAKGWGVAPGFPLCTAAAIRVTALASPGAAAAGAGAAATSHAGAADAADGRLRPADVSSDRCPLGEVVAFRCVSGVPTVSPLAPARMCRGFCAPFDDASLYDAAACGFATPADIPALLPVSRVTADGGAGELAWALVIAPAVPRPGEGFPPPAACRSLSDAALLRMSTSPEHEPPSFCPAFRSALEFAAGRDASAVAAFGPLPAKPRVMAPRMAAGGALLFDA